MLRLRAAIVTSRLVLVSETTETGGPMSHVASHRENVST